MEDVSNTVSATNIKKKSKKLASSRSGVIVDNESTTDQTDGEVKKKKEKGIKIKSSRLQSAEDDTPLEDTENETKVEKKTRDRRRKSLRDLSKSARQSRVHLSQGEVDPENPNADAGIRGIETRILVEATKSKFLKKPFKKPVEKTESDTVKETKGDDELLNIIHSYATDNEEVDEGDHGKEDARESEPRKFEVYDPISDSSDEYTSDANIPQEESVDTKKKDGSTFGKRRISLLDATATPHSHLDKLVDRVVGGGMFSAFPSEATFQRGHRLSVYDAVEGHLLRQGKKTFLFRTVIVASHEESSRELIAWHSKTVETINSSCYDELATGFFLIYPRYFVHVLEGSEETLCKFLVEHAKEFEKDKEEIAAIKEEEDKPQFTTVESKVIGFFSIRERFLERWVYEKTKPYNRRVHKGAFRKRLFEFLKCTFIMCATVGRLPENHPLLTVQVDKPTDEPETEEDKLRGKEVLAVEYIQRMREIAQWMPSKKTLMDILKRKPSRKIQLKSPRDFIRSYWSLPPIILTSETDWPIPCRIAPYD